MFYPGRWQLPPVSAFHSGLELFIVVDIWVLLRPHVLSLKGDS